MSQETNVTADIESSAVTEATKPAKPKIDVQPVLEKLFELYPALFGAKFLDSLKAALGFHTRSTRYLQCVADGHKRHDLQGLAGEEVAPEHVYLSLLELFRRRVIHNNKSRTKLELRPIFRKQLIAAFKASGLSRQDYQLRVQNSDEEATNLLTESLDEYEAKAAKQTALKQAFVKFDSGGDKATEFAQMYGLDLAEVKSLLQKE